MTTTKQQDRANFALKKLEEFSEDKSNIVVKKELSSFIVGMPTMILANGLGQSLAYLFSKYKKTERQQTLKIIIEYICENYKSDFGEYKATSEASFNFLKRLQNIDQLKYVKIQEDVLKMLEWLKRYARAFEEK